MEHDKATGSSAFKDEEKNEERIIIEVEVSGDGTPEGSKESVLTIRGLVQWDDTDEPIEDATVLVYSLDASELLGKTETNRRGVYALHVSKKARGQELGIYAVILTGFAELLTMILPNESSTTPRGWDNCVSGPAIAPPTIPTTLWVLALSKRSTAWSPGSVT